MKKWFALLLVLCMLPVSALAGDYLKADVVPVPLADLYEPGIVLHLEKFHNVVFGQYAAPYLYNDLTGEITTLSMSEEDQQTLRSIEPRGGYSEGFDLLCEQRGFLNAWFSVVRPRVLDYDRAGRQMLLITDAVSLLVDAANAEMRIVQNVYAMLSDGSLVCWDGQSNDFTVGDTSFTVPAEDGQYLSVLSVGENGAYAALLVRMAERMQQECTVLVCCDGEVTTASIGTYRLGRVPDRILLTANGALVHNRNTIEAYAPMLIRDGEVQALVWNGEKIIGTAMTDHNAVTPDQLYGLTGLSADGSCMAFVDMNDQLWMADLSTLESALMLRGEQLETVGLKASMMLNAVWDGGDYMTFGSQQARLRVIAP